MLEELTELYFKRKKEIKKRLQEFLDVSPEDYFYEMVYCILTPQTSAVNAEKAVTNLVKHRFHELDIDPLPSLYCRDYYIRFHHTKGKRLRALKSVMPSVQGFLIDGKISAFDKREMLVSNISGFGLKEATHFLRNIGKNEGLAILDRHILRNLFLYGAIPAIPESMSKKTYYHIENQFKDFAANIKIPLDELDLLFWSMETGIILK
jgi:N-glycosylase/DNA lyase